MKKAQDMEEEVGWKESLFVSNCEPFDWRQKCHFQGHTEYYVITLMTVGNGIQSAHPTVGGREIKLQFIKISSDEALI